MKQPKAKRKRLVEKSREGAAKRKRTAGEVAFGVGDSELEFERREAEARCRARDEKAAITSAAYQRSQGRESPVREVQRIARLMQTTQEDRELTRATVKRARYHVDAAMKAIDMVLIETDIEEKLAICVKALRGIANGSSSDARARGLAKAALKNLGVRL